MREAFAVIGLSLAICMGLASLAHASTTPRETAHVTDRFNLVDRVHVRVFEDGSARVCYRVRVWPLDYRPTFGRYTRVCGGVGVPW